MQSHAVGVEITVRSGRLVMSVSVCLTVCLCVCVCLPVRYHIFGTTRPIFTKVFMHVTYGIGSVLL